MDCPHCGKQVCNRGEYCAYCGKMLGIVPSSVPSPSPSADSYDTELRRRQEAELACRLKPRLKAAEQEAREKEERRIRETLGLDSID